MPKFKIAKGCSFKGYPSGTIIDVSPAEAAGWRDRVLIAVDGEGNPIEGGKPAPSDRKAAVPAVRNPGVDGAAPEPDNGDPGDEAAPTKPAPKASSKKQKPKG